jgi:hypothetical protein
MKTLVRRQLVMRNLVRGVTPAEIAQELDVPLHTVYNDMRVVRSGKFHMLNLYARDRIVCQLYLNATGRKRALWSIIDDHKLSPSHRIQAVREDRLNDQFIMNKLPPPRSAPADTEDWGDETDRVTALSVILKYEKHLNDLRKRDEYKNVDNPILTKEEKGFMESLRVAKYRKDNKGANPPPKVELSMGDLAEYAAGADRRFFDEFEC